MKKLVFALAAVAGLSAMAAQVELPGEAGNMQLDYNKCVKVLWCFNSPDMQDKSTDNCVQQFRADAIRGVSKTVHGVNIGLGQTRIEGSLIGAQGTIVMSKIDGSVIGACGATGASRVDGKVMGFQGACAARCKTLQNGCQAGVAVDADESKGVQVGIVTHTKKADSRKGIQIGLVNFCDNSKVPVFPFVNGPWLFGEKE